MYGCLLAAAVAGGMATQVVTIATTLESDASGQHPLHIHKHAHTPSFFYRVLSNAPRRATMWRHLTTAVETRASVPHHHEYRKLMFAVLTCSQDWSPSPMLQCAYVQVGYGRD